MAFHFDEEGLSIYYGFSAADVADLPAGKAGVVGVAAETGACFCYITATADTKRMLHELLQGSHVSGLQQYLAEHGGPHFMVEETLEAEARARQLIELYRPIFNPAAVACADADRVARNLVELVRSAARSSRERSH